MIIKTIFSFFWKIITFKKGSALIFSSIISSVFMLTANPIFDTLLKNTEFKNLIVPIVVQISGFTVFFLFVILDFVTGISFAIYEARKNGKKNYFETESISLLKNTHTNDNSNYYDKNYKNDKIFFTAIR